MKVLEDSKVALTGVGYEGLPLAVEFGTKYQTIVFDISKKRIKELQKGHDRTLEVSDDNLKSVSAHNPFALREAGSELYISDHNTDMSQCNI